MAELKTKQTKASVEKFIASIEEKKQEDSKKLLKIFTDVTKEKPMMWGRIIGFGKYHYKSERSSQEGDWFLTGFSPRKQAFSLYIMSGFGNYKELLKKLGTYKISGGCCLYIKKLDDIDVAILKKLIRDSVQEVKKRY